MLIQRLFQTVLISTLVAFVVPAAASSELPLCGESKAEHGDKNAKKNEEKDQAAEQKKKDDTKKSAKKDESDIRA